MSINEQWSVISDQWLIWTIEHWSINNHQLADLTLAAPVHHNSFRLPRNDTLEFRDKIRPSPCIPTRMPSMFIFFSHYWCCCHALQLLQNYAKCKFPLVTPRSTAQKANSGEPPNMFPTQNNQPALWPQQPGGVIFGFVLPEKPKKRHDGALKMAPQYYQFLLKKGLSYMISYATINSTNWLYAVQNSIMAVATAKPNQSAGFPSWRPCLSTPRKDQR